MPSSLTRRQTCPVTRHESEQLLDFFLNIPTNLSTTENLNQSLNNNLEAKDHVLQRPEFIRSDSYRKATQKFIPDEDLTAMTPSFKKEHYDRKKYMSLPINTTSKVRHNNNINTVSKKNKLNRQKSGTVPSSDSDNPTTLHENRKKKSVFKRTKERIIFILRKDKKYYDDEEKPKEIRQEVTSSEKRTSNSYRYDAALRVDSHKGQRNSTSNKADIIDPNRKSIKASDCSRKATENQTISSGMSPSKSPARARSFKTQISREEITNVFEKILSSAEDDEPFKFPTEHSDSKRVHKRKDFSPVRDISFADGIKNKKSGLKLNIVPFTPDFTREQHVTVIEDTIETSVGPTGEIKTVHKHRNTTIERTFSLEVDGGGDEIDGRVTSPSDENKKSQAEGGTEPLSPTDQEKMIEEIARRLNKIADDCVQRMGGDSHSTRGISDPLLSPNSRSRKLANDLVTELRKEGDRLSRELNLPDTLLPVVMEMVKQISYDHFKELIKKALCDTIGWDQVAMYLYVSRAAILMAGAGGQIARKLKDMAVRYFHEEICPWVYDRGGYDTMLEETDSEVD